MTIPAIENLSELQVFLDQIEDTLRLISEESGELSFQRYLDKKANPRSAELSALRAEIVLDPALGELVDHWYPLCDEPLLKRRLQLWQRSLVAGKVQSDERIRTLQQDLDQRMVAHRYLYRGERISLGDIRNIIRFSHDSEARKEAWMAYTELSDLLAPDLIMLIKLRNEIAQSLGFQSYVELVLAHNEMTENQVVGILEQLLSESETRYQEVLQQGATALGLETIQPWDVQLCLEAGSSVDPSYFPKDGIKPAVASWAKTMGVDMEELGIEMVFVDIPYNGLCMGIKKGMTKILGNPQDGFAYYKTMFHELGHALHGALNEVETPMLKRDSGIFTEGLAEVFGYVAATKEWLSTRNLPEEITQAAIASAIGPTFHYIRQRSAWCLFEYALYANPDADPNELMAKWESQVLGCAYDGTPRWASNAWFISYPVYWQNYVLADVMASQIHHDLQKRFGSLAEKREAFDFVIAQYIAPGAITSWLWKIEDVTGEPLNPKALIADLNK